MGIMEEIQFSLRPYQMEIVKGVQENIKVGNKMQTVLLPNGGGKTNLSFILSLLFKEAGKKVMYYSPEKMGKDYASRCIGTPVSNFDGVEFASISTIKKYANCVFDIVIMDAVTGCFDLATLA